MLPGLVDRHRTLVTDLGNKLHDADISVARAELAKLTGEIEVQTTESEIRLLAREGAIENALLREAGAKSKSVDGSGGELCMQIPAYRASQRS